MSFLASASWGGWVAQAAAFLLPRTVHSSSNFLSSCFLHTFSTFRIFRFLRVIASISLVSWRREPFASKRAVNKQKSQAEILENCQALPFCFRVSKRQRMRRCELERALQGYSIGYSAGSHEYTLKVDILAQPSTAPPPPICSQDWERAYSGPPGVRCFQVRRRA